MTPAQANLLRATALLSQVPASGVLRDGVREALAAVDAETARGLNAPRRFCDTVAARAAVDREFREEIEADDAQQRMRRENFAGLTRGMSPESLARATAEAGRIEWAINRLDKLEGALRDANWRDDPLENTPPVWRDAAPSDKTVAVGGATAPVMPLAEAVRQVRPMTLEEAIAQMSPEDRRAMLAPPSQSDMGIPITEQNQEVGGELKIQPSELPIAEAVSRKILDRAAFGLRKYGVSLDDAGLDPAAWLLHLQEELLDAANYVESFRRAMRETPAVAPVEPPQPTEAKPASAVAEAMRQAERETQYLRDAAKAYRAAPVEPPHAAAPVLAPLAPEPAEAVLGRAGEALAWDGQQLPVHVPFNPAVKHPYGDDAYQMTTDGKARMFPSREAAHRWLVAMGKAL